MPWNPIQAFIRRFFRGNALDDDLAAELRLHIEMEVRQRTERGDSPDVARQAAMREFGNMGLVSETTRDMWRFTWLEGIFQDVRYAGRMLRKSPWLSATVALMLTVGIGSTTTLFTFVHGILLRPLPFPSAERLVAMWELQPQSREQTMVAPGNFVAWKEQGRRSFERIGAFIAAPMNLRGARESEQVPGLKVTAEFFATLGTPPLLGRTFRPDEYQRSAPREAVLSYGAWQRRFGAAANAIGQTVFIDAAPHEIIGVMPSGFGFPGVPADFYTPLATNPQHEEGRSYIVVGRLRSGVGVDAARAELAGIAARTALQNVQLNGGWSATVFPLLDDTVGQTRSVLLILFGAVGLILLLACVNIANLLLMQSAGRTREILVRVALGASKVRIIRQLLIETLVLAVAGGLGGVAVAAWAVQSIRNGLPESMQIPRLAEVGLDWPVLGFSFGVTMLCALMVGLAPALQSIGRNLRGGLYAGSRSVTAGSRLRSGLVVAEVALAVVLVVGSGLMVRSFARLSRVDAGFRAENVLTVRMMLLPVRDEALRAETVRNMLTRIRALPGVSAAGSISFLPMLGINAGSWYYRADRPDPPEANRPGGDISIVTPGYFQALRIPIVRGRDFDAHDRGGAAQVGILNQTAARQLFPGEDPIGKRLKVWWDNSPTVEVVGVVADIRHRRLNSPPDPCLFMPNDQQPFRYASLVIRSEGDPTSLMAAVRGRIHEVDPNQGIANVDTMTELVSASMVRSRIEALFLTAFGVIALALACIGVYGVAAFSVTQRFREIGIRLALGASARSVFGMVLRAGLKLTLLGVVVGLIGAAGFARFLGSLLFEIKPGDPVTFMSVGTLIGLVAVVACYVPARRAIRVNPVMVLREE